MTATSDLVAALRRAQTAEAKLVLIAGLCDEAVHANDQWLRFHPEDAGVMHNRIYVDEVRQVLEDRS